MLLNRTCSRCCLTN